MSKYLTIFLLFLSSSIFSQVAVESFCLNQKFENTVNRYLKESVDLVSVVDIHEELNDSQNELIILDAREYEEYEVSHIPGALYIGYDSLNDTLLQNLDRNGDIVLYCSIGYRSEKIGEQMKELGFQHVRNLFGSIFEWTNRGFPIEDMNGEETENLHTYNKSWGKWVEAPNIKKQN